MLCCTTLMLLRDSFHSENLHSLCKAQNGSIVFQFFSVIINLIKFKFINNIFFESLISKWYLFQVSILIWIIQKLILDDLLIYLISIHIKCNSIRESKVILLIKMPWQLLILLFLFIQSHHYFGFIRYFATIESSSHIVCSKQKENR